MLHSDQNIMIVKKCKPFRLEVVVRAYITGNTKTSLWTHYKNGEREYCGILFPEGLVKNQKLKTPVITPTTKGVVDLPITPKEIFNNDFATEEEWNYIVEKSLELFHYGQQIADERGFILVDTKYEFGKDDCDIITLIDEIHTCDSSRYWKKSTYKKLFKAGKEPDKIDKDIVRDYVKSKCDPYNDPLPKIPVRLTKKVSKTYINFYEKLTGNKEESKTWKYISIVNICGYYFKHIINEFVVILSGSEKDAPFVFRIKNHLKEYGIYSADYVLSAHKNTTILMQLLHYYETINGLENNNMSIEDPKRKKKIIYITVAGRSNSLSGVVASNTNYPVIACPPFNDKMDMMVNIQSSLQMPSNVPVMTILEPGNVAIAVKRIFHLYNCRYGFHSYH